MFVGPYCTTEPWNQGAEGAAAGGRQRLMTAMAGGGVRGLRRGVREFKNSTVVGGSRRSPGRPFKQFKPCTLPSRMRLACAPCYFTSLSIILTSHLLCSNNYFLVRIVFHDLARLPRDLNMYVSNPLPPPTVPNRHLVLFFAAMSACSTLIAFGSFPHWECVIVT